MADLESDTAAMEADTEAPLVEVKKELTLKQEGQQDEEIKENGVEDEASSNEKEVVANGPESVPDEASRDSNKEATPEEKRESSADVDGDDKPKSPEVKQESSNDGDDKPKTPEVSKEPSIDVSNVKQEPLADDGDDKPKTPEEETKENKTEKEEKEIDNNKTESSLEVNTESEKAVKEEPVEVNGSAEEEMEVDEDSNSNVEESKSNISAPVSVDNDSKQASVVSEENSRDSVASNNMKSSSDAESSNKNGFIGKVKDEEGEDIMITLNDKTEGDSDPEDSQGGSIDVESNKSEDGNKAEGSESSEKPEDETAKTPSTQTKDGASVPPNAKVVRQGDQLGYLTKVGGQNIIVPVKNGQETPPNPNGVQKNGKQTPTQPPLKPEDLKPKSSIDMIELMRWELYNRVPDNFNWSVAFHPKKDELSSITSFLLELGHDVVKEAVYKDIIQIQTKKKENGDLRDNEVDSLEKMKTVYDNTKKKVEHLFLDTKTCDNCKFKAESSTVLNFHKDFPHYDPPWDTSKGFMKCSYCKFSTRVGMQFVVHMETAHKGHAKFPEKDHSFNCELCPLSTSTKNKLDKHRQKCEKHFKLGTNLQPYFHDVNFCMKTMYYKPKRPAMAKAASPQQSGVSKPPQSRTPIQLAQQRGLNQTPPNLQGRNPLVHPAVPKLTPPPRSPFQSTTPAKFRTATANMPNYPPRQVVPPNRGGRHTTNKEMQGFEVCELCGGYVKDRQALRIHFYYAHKVEMPQAIFSRPTPPLICDVCQSKFWTTQGLSKHKSTLRHFSSTGPTPAAFGTNQMCFMCMKKVPNLFSHVEQVHGMSMKDLVVMKKCIMCGVTAEDKRSLETHLATAHGILMKATDLIGSEKAAAEFAAAPLAQNVVQQQQQQTPPTPKSGKSNNLARQNLCVFCQIQFADNIQLTMHCIKIHATCNGCGMVVASTKHLMYHSCKVMKRKCVICGLKNIAPEAYAAHVKSHVKPCNVSVDKMSDGEIVDVKDKIKKNYKPQVISLDSDEDSEVEMFDKDTPQDVAKTKKEVPGKEPKHGDQKEKSSKEESQEREITNGEVKPDPDEKEESAEPASNRSEEKMDSEEKDNDTKVNIKQEGNQSKAADKPVTESNNHEGSPEKDLSDSVKTEVNSTDANNEMDAQDGNKKRKHSDGDNNLPEESEGDSKRAKLDEGSNAEGKGGADIKTEVPEDSNASIDV